MKFFRVTLLGGNWIQFGIFPYGSDIEKKMAGGKGKEEHRKSIK